jgi:hypothetical protein
MLPGSVLVGLGQLPVEEVADLAAEVSPTQAGDHGVPPTRPPVTTGPGTEGPE